MTRITHATRRAAEQLVETVFAVAESAQRIAAARANVDAEAVAVEQWEIYFNAGYYAKARQWWFENIERN